MSERLRIARCPNCGQRPGLYYVEVTNHPHHALQFLAWLNLIPRAETRVGAQIQCSNCGYETPVEESPYRAIQLHNRICERAQQGTK